MRQSNLQISSTLACETKEEDYNSPFYAILIRIVFRCDGRRLLIQNEAIFTSLLGDVLQCGRKDPCWDKNEAYKRNVEFVGGAEGKLVVASITGSAKS